MNQTNCCFQTILEVRSRLPGRVDLASCPTTTSAISDAPLSSSRRTQHRWSWSGSRAVRKVLKTRKRPYWVRPVPQWCVVSCCSFVIYLLILSLVLILAKKLTSNATPVELEWGAGSEEGFGNQEATVLGQAGPSMVHRLRLSLSSLVANLVRS